jgi:UDP-glucose 4-epimerase
MTLLRERPWLVTGAAGFLGSHLVDVLLERGIPTIALDNLSWGSIGNLGERQPPGSLRAVIADIRESATLKALFDTFRPAALIHLAALHYIPAAEADPTLALDINVRGTQSVLSAAEAAGVERIWFASTGDVYSPSRLAHKEEDPLGPFNVYGISKLTGERLVEHSSRRNPQRTFVVGRLFNLYGPRETNPHILPEILKQLRADPCATLQLGSLWPKRDFVPVRDAARVIVDSLFAAPVGLTTVNVGTGVARSMEEVIVALGELLGHVPRVETDAARVRPVDRPHLQADTTRLKGLLQWTPHTDMLRGLTELLTEGPLILPAGCRT